MNKFKMFGVALLAASLSAGFTSCSDDDDDDAPVSPENLVNPSQVFPQGLPTSVGGAVVAKNAKGQVTSVTSSDGESVKFSYGTFSRAAAKEYQAKMELYYQGQLDCTFYIQLNKKGFATYALQEYNGSEGAENEEWWFEYNSADQLSRMKRSEGDNEVTTITYTDGNITKVSVVDDDNTTPDVCTVLYTDAKNPSGVNNNGGVMFYDLTFGIDMDEFDVAYYAGMLGKSTKKLPLQLKYSETDRYEFEWTLNSKGLPTTLKTTEHYEGQTYPETSSIVW